MAECEPFCLSGEIVKEINALSKYWFDGLDISVEPDLVAIFPKYQKYFLLADLYFDCKGNFTPPWGAYPIDSIPTNEVLIWRQLHHQIIEKINHDMAKQISNSKSQSPKTRHR